MVISLPQQGDTGNNGGAETSHIVFLLKQPQVFQRHLPSLYKLRSSTT